jgi:hypothetical protein
LLWTRLLAPPAPAKAIAPKTVAIPSSFMYPGRFAMPEGASVTVPAQAPASVDMIIARNRKATMMTTSTISTFSKVW